jgi:hypothetical protein
MIFSSYYSKMFLPRLRNTSTILSKSVQIQQNNEYGRSFDKESCSDL